MNLYLLVPFLALVAIVEATVLPHLQVGNTQPDLVLLLVGGWSLRRGAEEGAVWGFVGGLMLDLLSSGPFPASTFALLAVSLILGTDPSTGLGRRSSQTLDTNPLALIFGGVLATVVFHAILLVALQLAGYTFNWLDMAVRIIVPHIVFNLVLMPVVYYLLGRLDRRTRREEVLL